MAPRGSPLNGMFGLLKVIDGTSGRDVEMPYRQAIRFTGGVNAELAIVDGVADVDSGDSVGTVGDQGPAGDLGLPGNIGVVQAIGLHDLTHNPVALWQGQESLVDTSANGHTLVVHAGTEQYGAVCPGVHGFQLGAMRLTTAAVAPLLAITGDMTVEMLLMISAPTTAFSQIVTYTYGTDDTSSTFNYLWQVNFDDATRRPYWFQEFGVGSNSTHVPVDQALPTKRLVHYAATRISNVVQHYCEGMPLGVSGAVTQATGGSVSQLYIGGEGGPSARFCSPMLVASIKVIASGLSAEQVLAERNRTTGKFYGYR